MNKLDELENKIDEWNESRKDKPSPQEYFYWIRTYLPLMIFLAFVIMVLLLVWMSGFD